MWAADDPREGSWMLTRGARGCQRPSWDGHGGRANERRATRPESEARKPDHVAKWDASHCTMDDGRQHWMMGCSHVKCR